MDNLPQKVTTNLSQIAFEENCNVDELVKIWTILPIGDSEELTYLEEANECILEASNMVDRIGIDLPQNQKTAKKLRLMGKLLILKAEQLAQ